MKIRLNARIGALVRELRTVSRKLDEAREIVFVRAEVVNLKDDDLVVFSTPHALTMETAARIREMWAHHCAELGLAGAKALVLDQGMTISALRPEHVGAVEKRDVA